MEPTLEVLVTVAGATPVVTVLVGVIHRALGDGFDKERFGPVLSIAVGILVTVGASLLLGLTTGQDIGQAILAGVLAGAAATGLYELQKGLRTGGAPS